MSSSPDLLTVSMSVDVPIEMWGKDHWTTLLYVETRCVDYGGNLSRDHLRGMYLPTDHPGGSTRRPPKHPTRIADGATVSPHDDIDCLADMVHEGLLEAAADNGPDLDGPEDLDAGIPTDELIEEYINLGGTFRLTNEGWVIAHALRQYRAEHGNTRGFVPPEL